VLFMLITKAKHRVTKHTENLLIWKLLFTETRLLVYEFCN
jgi:hypothetical protein